MNESEVTDEQSDNSRINWFIGVVLAAGVPLYVLVWMGHHWAEIAIKIYLVTACVFGAILWTLERKYLKQKWLWIGMVPAVVLHGLAMYGLVLFNEAFPRIDRVPVAAYGMLVPLGALETGILYVLIERFRPKKHARGTSTTSPGGSS
jgi:hypothetical protein